MSHMAEIWLEYHVDDCEFCSKGGDPHKCKRWEDEQDRADAMGDFLYDQMREDAVLNQMEADNGVHEESVSGGTAEAGREETASR